MPEFQILLVEDNPADARTFQSALDEASARVKVYWVATAGEAIEFLERRGRFQEAQPVKLVILDLNLGAENGVDLLTRIRKNFLVPVVFFTAARDPKDINRAYACGANAYFTKPMSLEQYIEKIRVLVEHWLDLAELPHSTASPELCR
jgi:CheY-like chemotaxis protein